MNELQEFKFDCIYELAELIDNSVKADVQFWNYNQENFINAATKFSKDSLLHLYIVTTSLNYYRREFHKNGDCYDEDSIGKWYDLFENYKIEIEEVNFDEGNEILEWFDRNIEKFEELFERMADEIFYILFANRQFLLNFNKLVVETVKEIEFSNELVTQKGTIKRVPIPQWVKTAVYHRDKGRCVFCNTDLTSLVNTLTSINYDHIVPLDLLGTNDPCNIQLACERCNKSKTNKDGSTSNKYIPWWKR